MKSVMKSVMEREATMSTIAMALAGGGPLGGIYEVGACAALSDSIRGLRLEHADI